MYTVKEVAKLMDLTEHTIRYYTDKGLIPSVKRDKNNNRLFDEESLNWLTGVKYLKATGMSIESIKEYVDLCLKGDSTVPERYEIILKQKEIAETQLEEAEKRVKYMKQKIKHYSDIVNNKIPDDTNPGQWDKNFTSKIS
ncbi:MerR family transcriptional regulator [Clostridium nigeriense]|uniref:MerR family transcriptional regulator n=1 Tax=Clostridium nigeriense TaxID=1805470 RepID=UPI003D349E92